MGISALHNGFVDFASTPTLWRGPETAAADNEPPETLDPPDAEFLRTLAWEIGERQAANAFQPTVNHAGLAIVNPYGGFAYWRILPSWVDETARHKGDAWHNCRLILRLYDVSYIEFTGLNAHQMLDYDLPGLSGHYFFKLPRPGTWQLAEAGFLLRNREFLPAARSQTVAFPPDSGCPHTSAAGLLVDDRGRVEDIGSLWEQEHILQERRRPRLRQTLRIATLAQAPPGRDDPSTRFIFELAAGQCARGHEVHVFAPKSAQFAADRQVDGVNYHPVDVSLNGTPPEMAAAYGKACSRRLHDFAPFDLVHRHEWLTGPVAPAEAHATVLSLTSIEATRRNGSALSPQSLEIARAEKAVAQTAACVLLPPWLCDRAIAELELDRARVRAFPMEGRLPNEWEWPLDFGQVKGEIGVGPLDRLYLFVGPLEAAAGVDLLVEALPVLLRRSGNLRVAFVGAGNMHGHLQHRAHELGVAHAVRLLGHMAGTRLTHLLRAAEALVLPSRYRVPFDDGVVDLARRAGRPVVTTHGGPVHLVRHEENGIITYDNPGSMVWAIDRLLGDPGHAERLGHNGRRSEDSSPVWSEVAGHYLELCAALFPQLTQTRW